LDILWPDLSIIHPSLTATQFEELRKIIYEKCGIYFSDQKVYLLEGRLSRRLKELKMNSFETYLNYLRALPNKENELIQVYNLITINETYFFRYDKQFFAFTQQLLPEVAKRKKEQNSPVKIWSAGCSSGEEPYSLAILVHEYYNGQLPFIQILGTDLSYCNLEKAQSGIYHKNSFRNQSLNHYTLKYFTVKDDLYQLSERIRKMVRFEYLNLNDTNRVALLKGQDFIFCRNVLIYFDDVVKRKIIRNFYEILNHGGYLFLGEAESLHGISSAFKVIHFQGGFCYYKE